MGSHLPEQAALVLIFCPSKMNAEGVNEFLRKRKHFFMGVVGKMQSVECKLLDTFSRDFFIHHGRKSRISLSTGVIASARHRISSINAKFGP
jgi:hypothetical protein